MDYEEVLHRDEAIRKSIWRKIAYSMGAIPSALPFNALATYAKYYYETVVGLPYALFTLAWIIYGVWNAINDPLAGYLMDRTRTKWGRRVPYILFGSIPLGISFMLIWIVPFTDPLLMTIYATFTFCLFDGIFTFVLGAWAALYPEMYETEKERAQVVAIKDFIAFISSFLGILLPPMLGAMYGWEAMGFIIGLVTIATMYISLIGTREKREYHLEEPLKIKEAFRETFKNIPFLYVCFITTIIDFAFGTLIMVLPYFAKFIFRMPEGSEGTLIYGVAIGLILSIPLWRYLYGKYGGKRPLILALLVFSLGSIPFGIIPNSEAFLFYSVIPGIGVGGMIMTEVVLSEAIDFDEIRTGKRREAMYTCVNTFIMRFSIVMSGVVIFLTQLTTGFNPELSVQPPAVEFGLRFLIGGVVPLIVLVSTLIFRRYPITYEKFLEMRKTLEKIHEEKRKKLLAKSK